MANEQRTAHVDNWNLWFRIAQCSCITNGNVHESLLGKSSIEGETPACRAHVPMQGLHLRVAFLGIGAQNGRYLKLLESKQMECIAKSGLQYANACLSARFCAPCACVCMWCVLFCMSGWLCNVNILCMREHVLCSV